MLPSTSTFCLILTIFILITTSTAIDTITTNQTLRDGQSNGQNNTLVSSAGLFELGFFSPGKSTNRYLGIWYKNISKVTVVWVANRDIPLVDTSGVLGLDANGILTLSDGAKNIIWSSSNSTSSTKTNNNPAVFLAQLLDTSNFVIKYKQDNDPENYIWQSFDHPGDHVLPSMKLGWDLVKGVERHLTSWRSLDDPSPGNYTFKLYLEGYPQMLVADGSTPLFRVGPWDGIQFSGVSFDVPDLTFDLKLVINDNKEVYSDYTVPSNARPVRFYLSPDGLIQIVTWNQNAHNWSQSTYLSVLYDQCDPYALCGAYGNCNITEVRMGLRACKCLAGFEPKSPEKWKVADWSDGCVRKTQLTCGDGDTFVKLLNLKLPDTRNSTYNMSMSLDDCETKCRSNCSCTAYSNVDITQGGCMLWFNELLDIRDYKDNGLPLYVRTSTESGVSTRSSKKKQVNIAIILIPAIVGGLLLFGIILIYAYKKRKSGRKELAPVKDGGNENESEDLELPLIDFNIVANATNNFSDNNKLGEGGFGPVYKGTLDDGQEIAVKRLSKTSRQGLDEFKNEVKCIAKLQHRNLVRLLGCCIEEGEMLLIYEYMPNKSLDVFIFDKELRKSLDWPKRYNIINGIAKGLLYLHQDSRLRIIHRDLKAGNILLDHEMSPKISDFGMARSFGGNESAVNTIRVVGTYGYMAPEYAIDGLFSVKSDAYSFGVLLLEIVSGKKIRQFYDSDSNVNLLGHAWKLYKDDKILDLIDETMVESCKLSEVARAIHIGLLCVQPYPQDRPNMEFVVSMLDSENELPEAKQPGFFMETGMQDSGSTFHNIGQFVSNGEYTVTFSAPR